MRARWSLTPDSFERLLELLGPDRQAASERYEELRTWLIGLFVWTRVRDPESLADVVLDRAAKRLAEGEQIENLKAWIRVAAKRVLQESYHSELQERTGVREASRTAVPAGSIEVDHGCLDECMNQLPPESRRLLERYYGVEGTKLIPARKELARDLGISVETLRTRALRLRKNLEQCMVKCRESRLNH